MRMPGQARAPLGTDLAQFYDAIGMPIIEGYGLTEGGVVNLNPPRFPNSQYRSVSAWRDPQDHR